MSRQGSPGREGDDLGSATAALVNATSMLSSALKQGLAEAGTEVGGQLATSLRAASRELADASRQIGRRSGEQRRQTKVQTTRSNLLAAAIKVFAEQGFEGAAVGDIATEAGYTKGALYSQFGSKEEIFFAVGRQLADECTAWSSDLSSPGAPDVAAVFPVTAPGPADRTRLLLSVEFLLYAIRHPESRPTLAPLLTQSLSVAADLIALRRGPTAEPTPHDRDVALGVVSVHTWGSILAVLSQDASETEQSAERAIGLLLGS